MWAAIIIKAYFPVDGIPLLRWLDRLKNDDIHRKYDVFRNIIFKALEHLQKKHFETILLNLLLVECKIQGKYTVV